MNESEYWFDAQGERHKRSLIDHPNWTRLSWDQQLALELLPLKRSEAEVSRSLGKGARWMANQKRQAHFKELVEIRKEQRGSIAGFNIELAHMVQAKRAELALSDEPKDVRTYNRVTKQLLRILKS